MTAAGATQIEVAGRQLQLHSILPGKPFAFAPATGKAHTAAIEAQSAANETFRSAWQSLIASHETGAGSATTEDAPASQTPHADSADVETANPKSSYPLKSSSPVRAHVPAAPDGHEEGGLKPRKEMPSSTAPNAGRNATSIASPASRQSGAEPAVKTSLGAQPVETALGTHRANNAELPSAEAYPPERLDSSVPPPPPSGQVADAVVASSHEDRAIPEVSGLETGPTKSSTAGKATLGVERGDPAKNAPVIPARPGKGGADPHVQEAVAGKASGNQQADGKELPAKKVSEKHQSAADGGIQSAAPSARLEPSPDASQRAFAESKAPVDSSGVTKGEKPAPTTPASLSADRVTAQRVQQAGPGKIALVTPSSSSLQSAVITSTQPELGSSVSLEQAREKDEPGNSVGNASPIPHVGRLAENQPVKEGGAQKPATGEVPHPEMHAPAPRVQGGQPAPGKANREISEEQASQRQTEPEKQLQTEPESRLQVQAADPIQPALANGAAGTRAVPASLQVPGEAIRPDAVHGEGLPPAQRREARRVELDQASASSGSVSPQPPVRQAHADDRAPAAPLSGFAVVNHSAQAVLGGSNPGMEHTPAGERGAGTLPVSPTGGMIGTATRASAQETIIALDAEPARGPTTWIHAGNQHAEAGFQDPALGWIGVRAEMGGGGIHAALVPGSTDAAQVLTGHMAGLNAYLAEHRTPVETLTLANAGGRGADSFAEQSANQSMQQGTGQGTSQDSNPDLYAQTGRDAAARSPSVSFESRASVIDQQTPTQMAMPAGTHISVIA